MPPAVGEVFYDNGSIQPPLEVNLTHPTTVDLISARHDAIVRFEATCSAPTNITVEGTLKQRINRRTVLTGAITASSPCTTTPTIIEVPVQVTSHPGRRWVRGNAQLDTTAKAFDPYAGADVVDTDATVVRLIPLR